VTDHRAHDPDLLHAIEQEVARTDLRLSFRDPALEARFSTDRQERSRLHNRVTVPGLTIIFDLFLLTQFRAAPEIVVLSAIMRGLLTLGVALFVLLDWRGMLGRLLGPSIVALAILPTVFGAIETLFTSSLTALPNLQAIPLIQLAVLVWRVSVRQAGVATVLSCLIFIAAVLTASYVPPTIVPSLILTDLAIGIAVFTFAIRLDFRDRQVFLFGLQAAIRGDMLAEQNRILAKLSESDALTGLGNRRRFDDALAEAWAEGAAQRTPVGLVMFDIDHFKPYNDAFGHRQGDACLQAVAEAATRCVRNTTDTLARYGGEEFAVVLRGATLDAARSVAERLREAVVARAIPHRCVGPPGVVTVSLGVASMVPGEGGAADLVEAADRCLYAAKRRGRNRVETEDLPGPDDGAAPYIKLVPPVDIGPGREAS
jgi:diguanylate cyclase (GGDEF)-like protein